MAQKVAKIDEFADAIAGSFADVADLKRTFEGILSKFKGILILLFT